jgi:hypothetical protein
MKPTTNQLLNMRADIDEPGKRATRTYEFSRLLGPHKCASRSPAQCARERHFGRFRFRRKELCDLPVVQCSKPCHCNRVRCIRGTIADADHVVPLCAAPEIGPDSFDSTVASFTAAAKYRLDDLRTGKIITDITVRWPTSATCSISLLRFLLRVGP